MKESLIVRYDGHCKLCNRSVRWIIRNDVRKRFFLVPLQSMASDTVQLFMKGKKYERSSAVLQIAIRLRFPWPLLGIFFLVPPCIRDTLYKLVSNNRKRWFGEETGCVI